MDSIDNHSVAELLAGLASRVNNLAVQANGQSSRILLEQQDDLTQLAMAAIAEDLDASTEAYAGAIDALNSAITKANTAIADISKIADVIDDVGKAISVVTNLLGY